MQQVPELQIAHHWELEQGNQNFQIHQVRVLQKFEEQTKCQMKMRQGKYNTGYTVRNRRHKTDVPPY
jgi:hypothetical protein